MWKCPYLPYTPKSFTNTFRQSRVLQLRLNRSNHSPRELIRLSQLPPEAESVSRRIQCRHLHHCFRPLHLIPPLRFPSRRPSHGPSRRGARNQQSLRQKGDQHGNLIILKLRHRSREGGSSKCRPHRPRRPAVHDAGPRARRSHHQKGGSGRLQGDLPDRGFPRPRSQV